MITIPTEDQVEARLEALPENLRSALFSIEITKLGEDIGLSKGLKSGDIPSFSEVIAWVLLGFTHSSGAAEAIEEYVRVTPEVAKTLAQELDQKIFGKFRADLEKIYAPMRSQPANMMDISAQAMPSAMPKPMPIAPMAPAPKIPVPAATPVGTPKEEPKGWQPTKLPVSGPVPVATSVPAPFMMHQESSASPLATGPDFKLNLSKDMFKAAPSRPIEVPRPPRAAELEIGKTPLPPKTATSAAFKTVPAMQSRVVHYTDMRTAMTSGISAAQPMPAPAAPKAPVPPMPAIKQPMDIAPKPIAAPAMPQMPKPPAPMKVALPPSSPMPVAPAPISQAPSSNMPSAPIPPKPPKVVNFGPEEVK